MSANVNSMFYYGEVPWHGLGTPVDHAATSDEAIIASGLDWPVDAQELVTTHGLQVLTHRATVRRDTNTVLGVVGSRYEVLQNRAAFDFFDGVVGQKAAIYHTAGSLGQGEKVWILAKLPGEIVVGKDDVTEKFLLLLNSHDSSWRVRMFFTPIRVVCQNTAQAAIRGFNSKTDLGVGFKHMGSMESKLTTAQQALSIMNGYYNEYAELATVLSTRQLSEEVVTDITNVVFPSTSSRAKNVKQQVRHLFESEKNNTLGISGTAWALYNAFVEWADYVRRVPNLEKNPTKRLESVWLGSAAQFKMQAMDAVRDAVGV